MKTPALEDSVASLLRYGVLLCGGVIAAGLLAAFLVDDATLFSTASAILRGASLPDAVRPMDVWQSPGALQSPEAWVFAGIAMLVALPVIRVAWLVFAFARNGEKRMAWLAAVVLVTLAMGIVLGAAH